MKFSIVINTLNRASLLDKTIRSLQWLNYAGEFEVIVVNGPSTDNSEDVIASWGQTIRVGKCELPNLSVSRNIGIRLARGDIVVFIDDDAIPEPEWLAQLALAYDQKEIGGVGGIVYDQTGYKYQYEYSTANRLGNANWTATKSAEHLCFPGSFEFPYLQGTNASFRRSALLEIGGFDEEIEFYLDETELCCRLIDAGYVVRQLANAYVHHKFAPSHIRDERRITRHLYPVVKNKIYFSLKHGRPYARITEILEDGRRFVDSHAADIQHHISTGNLPAEQSSIFKQESDQAWERALRYGFSDTRKYIDPATTANQAGDFLRFAPKAGSHSKTIVLICRDFPPNHSGGIATFNKDLAEALANEGHLVHVIAESRDICRVDLEHGAWIHRITCREIARNGDALNQNVPQHIWNWSASALEEARRISSHHQIDVVEAPIWDCEGSAFLFDDSWPLVTSLQTTLHFWIDSHRDLGDDASWMESFGLPMLNLERRLMRDASAIRAISRAIVDAIEEAYQFTFDVTRTRIVPLGLERLEARLPLAEEKLSYEFAPEILFVGRFEMRKGVDVLLKAIPIVLAEMPTAKFTLIGDDSLVGPGGKSFKEEFLQLHQGSNSLGNVQFKGKVNDADLKAAYARCDVFVAPSRFESFGLVFLEAMREGKPVIGCRAGGIPEIVSANQTGILVEPSDDLGLAEAILKLLHDSDLRKVMGSEGRLRFQEHFTSSRMASNSLVLYELAKDRFQERET